MTGLFLEESNKTKFNGNQNTRYRHFQNYRSYFGDNIY